MEIDLKFLKEKIIINKLITDTEKKIAKKVLLIVLSLIILSGVFSFIILFSTESKPISAIILIDISESSENELNIEKKLVVEILKKFKPEDKVGVIAFNADAYIVSPISLMSEKEYLIEKIMRMGNGGGTNIGTGILEAIKMFKEKWDSNNKNILIVSDGRSQAIDSTLESAKFAEKLGIKIYTMGIGDYPNGGLLVNLSQMTEGKYLNLEKEGFEIDKLFEKINAKKVYFFLNDFLRYIFFITILTVIAGLAVIFLNSLIEIKNHVKWHKKRSKKRKPEEKIKLGSEHNVDTYFELKNTPPHLIPWIVFAIFLAVSMIILLPTKVIDYNVELPYIGTEQYTIQVPYLDVEEYTVEIPHVEKEQYSIEVPYEDIEAYVESVPYITKEQYIERVPVENEGRIDYVDVIKERNVTKYRDETKYRKVTKMRTELRERDAVKTKLETKQRQVYKIGEETKKRKIIGLRNETKQKEVNWLFGFDAIIKFRTVE